MIKTLELKNWRTHKESKLEFGKGTNVIIGVMGSGKSSIINALSYSLFGTFPSLKSKQISLNEIIMNKPNKCDQAETKIVFENKKNIYTIQRIIKNNGTNEAKIYKNDVLIAGPKQKDVNEKVEQILGLNYELFSRAAYSEQNEIDFFLKLTPSERKKKFDELLELEKYEIARKNSLMLKNQMIRENKQQKEFIEQQKKIIKSYEEEKTVLKILEEEKKIKELEQQKENSEKKLKENKIVLEEMEKKETIYNEVKENIIKNKSKFEVLSENIKQKKTIELKEIIKENEELIKKMKFVKIKKENNEKQKEQFEEINKKISEEKKILKYRLKEIENEENEIKKIKGKCPKCLRELTEEHKIEIINKGKKIIEEINYNIKNVEKKEEQNLEKLNKIKEEQKNNDQEIDTIKEKIFILERNKREADEIEKYKKELQNLGKKIPEEEEKLKKISFDKKKLDEHKKNYLEIKYFIQNIDNNLENGFEIIKNLKENIERIKKIKNNIEIIEKKYLKSEKASEKLGIFETCLIATQNELRETLLENINNAMSQIWSSLYPYKDFVDARLCVIENGYDLQVLTRNGNWIRVEGILSGGERSAAAICIRIAFALVLTKQLSLFILDEPTHNLDKNAIARLSEMLNLSMPELVEQIFIITHEKEMEKAATSNLYLLQRNKDLDEITKIEVMPII
ncbi:MAG: AAA family ATPase, partial [Candidatus ainarchaeum sp.]|nr:AAA family ATPase [Candidatus ainarchaeum sp.]